METHLSGFKEQGELILKVHPQLEIDISIALTDDPENIETERTQEYADCRRKMYNKNKDNKMQWHVLRKISQNRPNRLTIK
jgi:hypothetical protein